MDRNELLLHINRCEELHERRKQKRFIYTVLFYAAVYMVIFYWQEQFSISSISETLAALVVSVIVSVVTCFFNALVFGQLDKVSRDEQAAIDYLKKRLKEKEQEDNYKKEML